MKTITQVMLVICTERPDDEAEAAHQLRVYKAVLDAANEALKKFKFAPVEGLGGGLTFGCATIIPAYQGPIKE